jgi:hypothetical protein
MKRTTKKANQPAFEDWSGNVVADLGLDDADERFTRAQLGFHVYQLLTARNLRQREIADYTLSRMSYAASSQPPPPQACGYGCK